MSLAKESTRKMLDEIKKNKGQPLNIGNRGRQEKPKDRLLLPSLPRTYQPLSIQKRQRSVK